MSYLNKKHSFIIWFFISQFRNGYQFGKELLDNIFLPFFAKMTYCLSNILRIIPVLKVYRLIF